jgi:hypothetical protein
MEPTLATQKRTTIGPPQGNLPGDAVANIASALRPLLADVFALYLCDLAETDTSRDAVFSG